MRLFLAIPLPEALREDAVALTRRLALDPACWRAPDPEGFHLTLRFLGEMAAEACARQDAAWRAAVSAFEAIPLEAGGCGFFPGGRRARVVWLAVRDLSDDGVLARLAAALEREARAAGLAAERRPFAPHVTLARARRPAPAPTVSPEAERPLGSFVAREVVLFRSVTAPAGARYVHERTYPLAAR